MAQDRIEERIKDTVYQAHRKKWYQRWWGMFILIASVFLILAVSVFIFRTYEYYNLYRMGEITEFTDTTKQQARLDLLYSGNDPIRGPASAKVTIVAFEDFQCPYCAEAQSFLQRLLLKYPDDVRLIYKDFPLLAIHPEAQRAAEAAQCAFEQNMFWEFHDVLFANQDHLSEAYYRVVAKEVGLNLTEFNTCFNTNKYKARVTEDQRIGDTLGVVGTPAFFINGELVAQGYADRLEEEFEKVIEFIMSL